MHINSFSGNSLPRLRYAKLYHPSGTPVNSWFKRCHTSLARCLGEVPVSAVRIIGRCSVLPHEPLFPAVLALHNSLLAFHVLGCKRLATAPEADAAHGGKGEQDTARR